MNCLLQIDSLTKSFGRTQVLKEVSLSVEKGEAFGLVGESGCGKTTLGRTVMGLYPADSGSVCFDGQEILGLRGRARKQLARRLQMVFQDPIASLDPRMTVEELVCEGLLIHGAKRGEKLRKQALAALDSVGLPSTALGRYPHEFSGGQRQRIGIARAVVMRPSMLIADEPVSALDVSVQAQVINLLADLKKELSLTVLFVAHDLSVVRYFCDRVAVMYAGQIVEIAPSEQLFSNPLHGYTRSLLSAIPPPDPVSAKRQKRIAFEEEIGENMGAGTRLTEVSAGHFVRQKGQE